MQIISNKFKEVEMVSNLQIGGKWNILIMNPNGTKYYPFGEDMKDNLLLNNAYNLFAEAKSYARINSLNWNTASSFFTKGDAVLGSGRVEPQPSDTELSEFKYVGQPNPNSYSYLDNILEGSRAYTVTYDFPDADGGTFNEAGVRTAWGKSENNNQNVLFSKFLFPNEIKLLPGQWIKLLYTFKIKIPMIVEPTIINTSSGSVNANGTMRLIGRFDDIFGPLDEFGNLFIRYGDSPRGSIMPFWEEFCENENCNTSIYGTSYLIKDVFSQISQKNSALVSEWVGKRLSVKDQTIVPSTYNKNSFFRDITYIFDKLNPDEDKLFQGFLFTVTKSNRENTVDGWFWNLNEKQTKLKDKKIVINLRQLVVGN